jgi:hypothetical protein
MEATAEAVTGVTADEWMDAQKPALEALLADRAGPAFRAVLDSFEPDGFDLDTDTLFESGLSYLLEGFHRAPEMRSETVKRNWHDRAAGSGRGPHFHLVSFG